MVTSEHERRTVRPAAMKTGFLATSRFTCASSMLVELVAGMPR